MDQTEQLNRLRLPRKTRNQHNAQEIRAAKAKALAAHEEESNRRIIEAVACAEDFEYFCNENVYIKDVSVDTGGAWIKFKLWEGQTPAVHALLQNRQVIILKARQLGMTWLCLAYALWTMLFRPDSTVLLFSLRDDEAKDLLKRLYEMYHRLPAWLRHGVKIHSAHELGFTNGSTAKAFPTTAGDSYNATLAIVDEADLVPDLNQLMGRVKPTIDAGGQLFMVSRVDKSRPESTFKNIYRESALGKMKWKTVFLPWSCRPERLKDPQWYPDQVQYSLSTTQSLDWVHEQYPATPEEALAPRSQDKRIPPQWLLEVFKTIPPVDAKLFKAGAPSYSQLKVYQTPDPRRGYVIGGDPAEGNPNSDDSACIVLDDETGEEVASIASKTEPAVFASIVAALSHWYCRAPVLVERNNHGHAVLMWLKENGKCRILNGEDDKPGFMTTPTTKIKLYDALAENIRIGKVLVRDMQTYIQLSSIEAASLSAPDGLHDDRAVAFALANYARKKSITLPKPQSRDYQAISEAHRIRQKISI